jgi:two-component system, chemotaxis family, chemotaxis protein CheY
MAVDSLTHVNFSDFEFLLVDDNGFIRKLLKEILIGFGVNPRNVGEASSVNDALNKFDSRPPDIVLCDWMMSPRDGIDFLKEVRFGRKARTPVVMITGYATPQHVTAALGEGADSFIVKPFRPATLMDHLLKVISATQAQFVLEI